MATSVSADLPSHEAPQPEAHLTGLSSGSRKSGAPPRLLHFQPGPTLSRKPEIYRAAYSSGAAAGTSRSHRKPLLSQWARAQLQSVSSCLLHLFTTLPIHFFIAVNFCAHIQGCSCTSNLSDNMHGCACVPCSVLVHMTTRTSKVFVTCSSPYLSCRQLALWW